MEFSTDPAQDNMVVVRARMHITEAITLAAVIAHGIEAGPRACLPVEVCGDDLGAWEQSVPGLVSLGHSLVMAATTDKPIPTESRS